MQVITIFFFCIIVGISRRLQVEQAAYMTVLLLFRVLIFDVFYKYVKAGFILYKKIVNNIISRNYYILSIVSIINICATKEEKCGYTSNC